MFKARIILNKSFRITGGKMSDLFKINEQFDEKGDELEKIISYFLISHLEKNSTIKENKIL